MIDALAKLLARANKKLVSQQFSLAPLWFQNPVAAKHNNPQDKPVVFESHSPGSGTGSGQAQARLRLSTGTGSMDCLQKVNL